MNAAEAKEIAMNDFMKRLGFTPDPLKSTERNTFYLSPIRNEKTASLAIDNYMNTWFDFGEGAGGNIFDLIMKMNQCDFKTALKFINDIYGNRIVGKEYVFKPVEATKPPTPILDLEENLSIVRIRKNDIYTFYLKQYIERRGISINVVKQFCHEIEVFNRKTDKSFFVVAFENRSGGYELRNEFTKFCLGKKDFTFIKGKSSTRLNMFEGYFDFLTHCEMHGVTDGIPLYDTIIFNSTHMKKRVLEFLGTLEHTYEIIQTYFNNDAAGEELTNIFTTMPYPFKAGLVLAKNEHFKNYNDLNQYWVDKKNA